MANSETRLDAAKSHAADLASDIQDSAAASAQQEAEKLRRRAIDETEQAASAADAAHEEFDADSLQAMALNQLGVQLGSVAAHLRDKPVDAMIDDVAVFARKNPLLFLGGAALAGFAAARFLKSGSGSHNSRHASDDPWSGHLANGDRRP